MLTFKIQAEGHVQCGVQRKLIVIASVTSKTVSDAISNPEDDLGVMANAEFSPVEVKISSSPTFSNNKWERQVRCSACKTKIFITSGWVPTTST
jgi:hypothetical protein